MTQNQIDTVKLLVSAILNVLEDTPNQPGNANSIRCRMLGCNVELADAARKLCEAEAASKLHKRGEDGPDGKGGFCHAP